MALVFLVLGFHKKEQNVYLNAGGGKSHGQVVDSHLIIIVS
jgi:hypothetical protein